MLIFAFVPLLIIVGIMLLKKIDIKLIINGIFFGIISILISFIFTRVVLPFFGISFDTFDSLELRGLNLFWFLTTLLIGALPEEVSKYISIKLAKSKDKKSIFINSVLVALTFLCIENFVYIFNNESISLIRMLHLGHLFYQVIMAALLIKSLNCSDSKKIIFRILTIVLPILCHALCNTINSSGIKMLSYIYYGIGILTYILVFIHILKLSNSHEESKVKFFGVKVVFIILTILASVPLGFVDDGTIELNKNQIISEENIELKVISSEKVDNSNDFLGGNYIKVKVELKNNTDLTYIISMFDFNLIDKLGNSSHLEFNSFNDELYEVAAGETGVGYLYFEDEGYNYVYLRYGSTIVKPYTYTFKLK